MKIKTRITCLVLIITMLLSFNVFAEENETEIVENIVEAQVVEETKTFDELIDEAIINYDLLTEPEKNFIDNYGMENYKTSLKQGHFLEYHPELEKVFKESGNYVESTFDITNIFGLNTYVKLLFDLIAIGGIVFCLYTMVHRDVQELENIDFDKSKITMNNQLKFPDKEMPLVSSYYLACINEEQFVKDEIQASFMYGFSGIINAILIRLQAACCIEIVEQKAKFGTEKIIHIVNLDNKVNSDEKIVLDYLNSLKNGEDIPFKFLKEAMIYDASMLVEKFLIEARVNLSNTNKISTINEKYLGELETSVLGIGSGVFASIVMFLIRPSFATIIFVLVTVLKIILHFLSKEKVRILSKKGYKEKINLVGLKYYITNSFTADKHDISTRNEYMVYALLLICSNKKIKEINDWNDDPLKGIEYKSIEKWGR